MNPEPPERKSQDGRGNAASDGVMTWKVGDVCAVVYENMRATSMRTCSIEHVGRVWVTVSGGTKYRIDNGKPQVSGCGHSALLMTPGAATDYVETSAAQNELASLTAQHAWYQRLSRGQAQAIIAIIKQGKP